MYSYKKSCRFESNEKCTNVRRHTSQSECNTNTKIRINKMQTNRDSFRYHAGTGLLDTTHFTSRHSAIQIITILLLSHLKANLYNNNQHDKHRSIPMATNDVSTAVIVYSNQRNRQWTNAPVIGATNAAACRSKLSAHF